jgi:hypothetical protein
VRGVWNWRTLATCLPNLVSILRSLSGLDRCMAAYDAAVPSSRATDPALVSQPPPKVSGLLYGLRLMARYRHCGFTKSCSGTTRSNDVSRYPVTPSPS